MSFGKTSLPLLPRPTFDDDPIDSNDVTAPSAAWLAVFAPPVRALTASFPSFTPPAGASRTSTFAGNSAAFPTKPAGPGKPPTALKARSPRLAAFSGTNATAEAVLLARNEPPRHAGS